MTQTPKIERALEHGRFNSLNLPGCEGAAISVRHGMAPFFIRGISNCSVRCTEVLLTWLVGDQRIVHAAVAWCSPTDNFCKREGRRRAAAKLLQTLRHNSSLTRQDRREVFKAICPEYFTPRMPAYVQ